MHIDLLAFVVERGEKSTVKRDSEFWLPSILISGYQSHSKFSRAVLFSSVYSSEQSFNLWQLPYFDFFFLFGRALRNGHSLSRTSPAESISSVTKPANDQSILTSQ